MNAFIFLIAGVIALFITNRVTRSFLLISEKMKEVNLGQTNETITWKRDDEIGKLVTEYNKMVNNVPLGYTSIIVALFFSTGMIMMSLGIIGEYIRKIWISQNNLDQILFKTDDES